MNPAAITAMHVGGKLAVTAAKTGTHFAGELGNTIRRTFNELEEKLPQPSSAAIHEDKERRNSLAKGLNKLEGVMNSLPNVDISSQLEAVRRRLTQGRVPQLAFVGQFSAGKSTLINALLGKDSPRLLPVANEPTTANVTQIMWGEQPRLYFSEDAWQDLDANAPSFSLDTVEGCPEVAVTLPDFPVKDVIIADTPGLLETDASRMAKTQMALPLMDALVVVLNATSLEADAGIAFLKQMTENDVDRPLFVVVNKADEIENIDRLKNKCSVLLLRNGLSADRVYTLSAKHPEIGDFNTFKADLLTFLEKQIHEEAMRHAESEIDGMAKRLSSACLGALGIASEEAEARDRDREAARAEMEELQNLYLQPMQKILQSLSDCQGRFIEDFNQFMDSQSIRTRDKILASSLQELSNPEALAYDIKAQIANYVETELSAVVEALQQDCTIAENKLRGVLASMNLPLYKKAIDTSNVGKLVVPGYVVFTLMTGGLLSSAMALVYAALAGSFVEKFISGTLSTIVADRQKQAIADDVSSKIRALRNDMIPELNNVFAELGKQIRANFEQAANALTMPLAMSSDPTLSPQRIAELNEELQSLKK